jgi:hypothetical protein
VTFTVSDRARSGFDYFIAHAAKQSLAQPGAELAVLPADDVAALAPEVVMFTVSSYMFRVLLFMHFEKNTSTRSYFATLANATMDEMVGDRFLDAVMERGNLLCGSLNRELALFFPHLGMSTPCVLQRNSLDHIDAVLPTFVRRYRAEVTPAVALHFTLVVCAFTDIDFAFEVGATQEAEISGELEMF